MKIPTKVGIGMVALGFVGAPASFIGIKERITEGQVFRGEQIQ